MPKNFYGLEVTGSADTPPVSTAELLEVFEILKPKASSTPLIRIGADRDGAYLVPDDLEGITACLSPGVNRIKYFEDYLTDRYNIRSHMCDFTCTVDEFRTPLKSGMQTFLKKWLDVTPGTDNISLEDWVQTVSPDGGDLLLQMDIEGAEYRNILATSDDILARFRVIVVEIHSLNRMLDTPVFREVIAPFFRKLSRNFISVHAHPNNAAPDFLIPGTDVWIPKLIELTLLRADRFVPASGGVMLPHPLDVSRNIRQKPPRFLSGAWCDHTRPLESRLKMLEDRLSYQEEIVERSAAHELSNALSLTMQSLQTIQSLQPVSEESVAPQRADNLVEVASGCPYLLSSAYGQSSTTGVVKANPRTNYFFHTNIGRDESIRVDLGQVQRIRRIKIINRLDQQQARAKLLFVVLADDNPDGATYVFPVYKEGDLPGGAWQECEIDLPDVGARFLTFVSPVNTALHFFDLQVFAEKG